MPKLLWGAETYFTKGGEVISDKFDHLTEIAFRISVISFWIFWGGIYSLRRRGGGSPIPKYNCQKIDKRWDFLWNASWGLKCKMNHFVKHGVPKRGVTICEKFPNNPVVFIWVLPLSYLYLSAPIIIVVILNRLRWSDHSFSQTHE